MAESGVLASILTVAALCALFIFMLYGLVLLSRRWKNIIRERITNALKRRRNAHDNFRDENGYSWDYVMVFKVYREEYKFSDKQCRYNMRTILAQIAAGGLELRLFYSLQRREVFCKIRCPLARLQKHADLVDYKLLFDQEKLQETCMAGREGCWEPLKIPLECEETHLNPYQYIYGKYEFDEETSRTDPELAKLYKKWSTTELQLNEQEVSNIRMELQRNSNRKKLKKNNSSNSIYGHANDDARFTISNPLTDNSSGLRQSSSGLELTAVVRRGSIVCLEEEGGGRSESIATVSSVTKNSHVTEEASMFRSVDRLKLIHMIINYHGKGGCCLEPAQLVRDKCIRAYFPLHDMVELHSLEEEWLTFFALPWYQPVDRVKDYFGEKIGLYFVWIGLYTSWLLVAAVLGLGFWFNVATNSNNPNTASVPYFAGIMGLWSALFLEHWKRTEKITAMQWGMVGYEAAEQARHQFYGEKVLSAIDGHPTLYYSDEARSKKICISNVAVYMLMLLILAVVASIFALRVVVSTTHTTVGGVDFSIVLSSVLLALQIQLLNGGFAEVAIGLNDHENYRTDTEYEDALIAKTFCLQFVNSFTSLFYIAFVKPYIATIDGCANSNCLSELQITLGTIFLMHVTIGNITELGIPMVKAFYEHRQRHLAAEKRRLRNGIVDLRSVPQYSGEGLDLGPIVGVDDLSDLEARTEMSEVESSFTLPCYHAMLGTFEDYAELVIQFGFTTMFVAAFPLATVLSFVNNYVEMRVDGWKLCELYRRVQPQSVEDIGTWYDILEIVSGASIFINSGLVAFTASNLINYTWAMRIWVFILMAAGLFSIRLAVAAAIPDCPTYVDIQLARQDYIVGKVIDNIEDDDEDAGLSKTGYVVPDFLVGATDNDPM